MAKITGRLLPSSVRNRTAQGKVILLDAMSAGATSPQFQVKDFPVTIGIIGAIDGVHTVRVDAVYGTGTDERSAPFSVNGVYVTLDSNRNTVTIKTTGRYRVTLEGGLGPVVYAERQDVVGEYPVIPIKQASSSQYNLPNLFLNDGKLSNRTQIIQIDNKPWTFTAFGLSGGDEIKVYVTYGQGSTYKEELYKPDGKQVVLSESVNNIRLDRTGRYRFELDGDPSDVLLVGNETIIQPAPGEGGGGVGGVQVVNTGSGLVGGPITDIGTISLSPSVIARLASALQPGDNISELVNDAGYIGEAPLDGQQYARQDGAWHVVTGGGSGSVTMVGTGTGLTGGPITSTGVVSLNAASIASLAKADTALQAGANISLLTNNAGYITAAGAPVTSVNGQTGAVALVPSSIGAEPAFAKGGVNVDTGLTLTGSGAFRLVGAGALTIGLHPSIFAALALAESALQAGDNISELVNNTGYITDAPVDGQTYGRQNNAWVVSGGGGGTVTEVATGTGLVGGPINLTGTISLSAESQASLALADTALQAGAIIPAANVSGLATVATTGSYNDLGDKPSIPTGTVMQVDTGDGLAGGPITSTGVISLNSAALASLVKADSALQPGAIIPASDITGLAPVATTGSYNDLVDKPTIPDGTVTQVDTGAGLSGGPINSVGTISLAPETIDSLARADSALQPGAVIPAGNVSGLALVATTGSYTDLSDKPDILPDAPADGQQYVRYNNSWVVGGGLTDGPHDGSTYGRRDGSWVVVSGGGGGGTVTEVDTGTGLIGGPITGSGTIALNAASIASLALADSALQVGDDIPASDITGLAPVATSGAYADLTGKPTILPDAPADGARYVRRNNAWESITLTAGTVTNVATGTGLTGGPISSTGTIALNAGSIASLAKADTALQPGAIIPAANVSGLATVATTGAYADLTGKPVLTNGTVTNVATGTGLTGGPITATGTVALNAASIASLGKADTALQPGAIIPAANVSGLATVATTGAYNDLSGKPTILPDAPANGNTYGRKDNAWVIVTPGGVGTVTQVDTGTGLTGGPITGTGTVALSSASIASLALANTALQPGALSGYLPLSGGTITGNLEVTNTIRVTTLAIGADTDSIFYEGITDGVYLRVGPSTGRQYFMFYPTGQFNAPQVRAGSGVFVGNDTNAILAPAPGTNAAGVVYIRPDGSGDTTGQLVVNLSGMSWDGNTVYHAGNLNPASFALGATLINAGVGLTGGGSLAANRTISMGTPSNITLASTNSATGTTHTHAFNPGGTSAQYIRGDGQLATLPTAGSGTVTSVAATGGTGITIGGSPITTSGTLTFALSTFLQTWSGIAPASKADVSALNSYVLKAGDTMTGPLNINLNATTPPGMLSGLQGLYIAGANNGNPFLMMDAFIGGSTGIIFRTSSGTALASAALTDGQIMGQVQVRGHDGTAYSTQETASLMFRSSGLWTNASHPTRMEFSTTPAGSLAAILRMTLDENGNLAFNGTGQRILGDFNNATQANRLSFQSIAANSNTSVQAIPSGTATTALFMAMSSSDASNSSAIQLRADSTGVNVNSTKSGTGVTRDMSFQFDSTERMRLTTAGNLIVTSGYIQAGNGTSGTKVVIGDDAGLGDVGIAHAMTIRSTSDGNQGRLYFADRDSLYNGNDGWLRLNQSGHYSNGVYTPGRITAGSGTFSGNVDINAGGRLYIGSVGGEGGEMVFSGAGGTGGDAVFDSNGDNFRWFGHPSGKVMSWNRNNGILYAPDKIEAQNSVTSRGPVAMVAWDQRDNPGDSNIWGWYASGTLTRLWKSGVGDRLTVNNGGDTTISGWVRANGVFSDNGEMTIGTASVDACTISVRSNDGTGWLHANSGQFGFLQYNTFAWAAWVDTGGNWLVTNNIVAYASDERLKKNIQPYRGDMIDQLEVMEFDWNFRAIAKLNPGFKPSAKHEVSGIAQQFEEVYPIAVHTHKNTGVKTIIWDKVAPLMLAEIQRLRKRVEKLERKAA